MMSTYVCVPSVSGASCGIVRRITCKTSSTLTFDQRDVNGWPTSAGAARSPSRSSA